ncbi:hypothetical protein [Paenibacillus polymyxa]|uniref:hypothetical protein n=1 Tax=Paenibacillus polymyxa TaxID=1406 RepID=UPI00129A3009|nr:hypothetical protein [Paenibacillus polymyxa]KAE8560218.1 hypothetical protein BJH92_10070 [Paenibacillus polymyxa]MCJ1221248.1 hypothetical protein [Paenibacillus polymyxa]
MENKTLKYIPGYYPYRIDEDGKVFAPHAKTGFPVLVKESNRMVNVRQDGRAKRVKVAELYRRAFNKLMPED